MKLINMMFGVLYCMITLPSYIGIVLLSTVLITTSLISPSEAEAFHEGWESTQIKNYLPDGFITADEGVWILGDTVSEFPECGPTPQRADILTIDGSKALRLTSNDSNSGCADNVWVTLFDTNTVGPINLNKGFSIPVNKDTFISFEETGSLIDPQIHGWGRNCINPPCFDNISLVLADNRGNILAYVLQRAPIAEENVNNVFYKDIYREIFLDPDLGLYTRNLFDDLSTIPMFSPNSAQITSIEFKVDDHGWAIIDNIAIDSNIASPQPPLEQLPIPDIKANNSDGPAKITQSENLSITLSFDSGTYSGEDADWWIVAYTPSDWYYLNIQEFSWLPWLPDTSVTYQGPLFDFSSVDVSSVPGLPTEAGTYTFFFGADMHMNGVLDVDELYVDSVEVNIIQSMDPNDMDDDGDGYTENQGDCCDNNPNIYPGATEICGDGIDQDCNGIDLPCLNLGCESIAGTWIGNYSEVYCDGENYAGYLSLVIKNDCSFTSSTSATGTFAFSNNTISTTFPDPEYECGTVTFNATINGSQISGQYNYQYGGSGTISGSKKK